METHLSKSVIHIQHNSYFSAWKIAHVILLISMTLSYGQKLAVPPCTDMKAISWKRDINQCNKYFICHFGSPLSMPPCPDSQVWSNKALNCVPVYSRWDDCSTRSQFTRSVDNFSKTRTKIHSTIREFSKYQSTKLDNSKTFTSLKGRKRPKDKIKRIKDTSKWHQYGNTRLPTKMPLFTRKDPSTFWTTRKRPSVKIGYNYHYNVTRPTQPLTTNIDHRDRTDWNTKNTRGPGRYWTTQRTWTSHNYSLTTLKETPGSNVHVCVDNPGAFLPHPTKCHWYYNCSLANLDDLSSNNYEIDDTDDDQFMRLRPFRVRNAGAFVWECRYPQLFDDVTYSCREFINVRCGTRFEPVDQCEYSHRQCGSGRCESCLKRFGRCRGRQNGIYPIQTRRWSPVFMTCYQSRNIAQDRCKPPKPIFSPDRFDCVSLFEVPKADGGLLPDCTSRPDGYYPDEQGRCAIFFRCSMGKFRGFDECPPASVFDPAIPACQPYSVASMPCGAGQPPLCGGRSDGMYADLYGRCTHFFQCSKGVFRGYHSCDEGIFDPLTQSCIVSAAQTLRPCGIKPSPCESLPTGIYPDQGTNCRNFIDCHQGIIITNGTCDTGLVFSATTGRCGVPQNAPPPCGVASTCLGRRDGRYPALDRGCSFFYECYHGKFSSLRRCTAADGGFFFNPATGRCDYPQNICPPCGHRWWGCTRHFAIK